MIFWKKSSFVRRKSINAELFPDKLAYSRERALQMRYRISVGNAHEALAALAERVARHNGNLLLKHQLLAELLAGHSR